MLEKKEVDLAITKIAVTSRRSGKVGLNDFFTFECMLESDTTELTQEETDKRLTQLWQKANSEVDKQFEDI